MKWKGIPSLSFNITTCFITLALTLWGHKFKTQLDTLFLDENKGSNKLCGGVKKKGSSAATFTFTGTNKNDLHEGIMGGAPQIKGLSALAQK